MRDSNRRSYGSNNFGLRASPRLNLPWNWHLASHTLVIKLPVRYRALGWAPMGGGLKRASAIINHQIARDDRVATEAPVPYLSRLAISLGFRPRDCIAMMTGANVNRGGRATMRRRGLAVSGWCTAGCSNALRVGDRATASSSPPGTINIAVVINRPVTIAALAEGLQVAVEARILAVQETGLKSIRSGLPATGTGTDCIVVAAPEPEMKAPGDVISYCGKHTVLGELIGRTVMRACTIALNRQAGSA